MNSSHSGQQSRDKDIQFIKKLLDASEKHNKNLSELISILKKNLDEEKAKCLRLSDENVELRREMNTKSLVFKQLEQELNTVKINEQNQISLNKVLKDRLGEYHSQLSSLENSKKMDASSQRVGRENFNQNKYSNLHYNPAPPLSLDQKISVNIPTKFSQISQSNPTKVLEGEISQKENINILGKLSSENQISTRSDYQKKVLNALPQNSSKGFQASMGSDSFIIDKYSQDKSAKSITFKQKSNDREASPSRTNNQNEANQSASFGGAVNNAQNQGLSSRNMINQDNYFPTSAPLMSIGSPSTMNINNYQNSYQPSNNNLSYGYHSVHTNDSILQNNNMSKKIVSSNSFHHSNNNHTNNYSNNNNSSNNSNGNNNSNLGTNSPIFCQNRLSFSPQYQILNPRITCSTLTKSGHRFEILSSKQLNFELDSKTKVGSPICQAAAQAASTPCSVTVMKQTSKDKNVNYGNLKKQLQQYQPHCFEANNNNHLKSKQTKLESTEQEFQEGGKTVQEASSQNGIYFAGSKRGKSEDSLNGNNNNSSNFSNSNNNSSCSNNNSFSENFKNSNKSIPSNSNKILQQYQINLQKNNSFHEQSSNSSNKNKRSKLLNMNQLPGVSFAKSKLSSANITAQKKKFLNEEMKALFLGRGQDEEGIQEKGEEAPDTIANIEEDIDEAANLENLSGSHFKFTLKNSCKNLKIKTHQYFSKIENPSVQVSSRGEQEINKYHISNKVNSKMHSIDSRSGCDNHQSVEIYSQINNKMSAFKEQGNQQGSEYPSNNVVNVVENKITSKQNQYENIEPGKRKKQLEENLQKEIGSQLFERFMIIGPNQDEISAEATNVQPSVYFKYPEEIQVEKGRDQVFMQFAFPFGVDINLINLTDSLSQLQEIYYSNNLVEANDNCFVFAIKSNLSYKQHKQTEQPISQSQELLQICNSQKLLYGVCFRVKEIIEKVKKMNETHNLIDCLKNNQCYLTQKLFCFLTYYPFHRFFLDVIASMLNQLKMKRIERYPQIQEKGFTHQFSTSNDLFQNIIQQEFVQLLQSLSKLTLPSPSSTLKLSFKEENITFSVPDKKDSIHLEAGWGCNRVLSIFEKEEFVQLLLSLFIEQSLVFVSSNSALLSSALLLFHSLMKPFKWHHPLIFNLPSDFTHLLDIPVPILVGLNKDLEFLRETELTTTHSNCIFIVLEGEVEIINSHLIGHIPQSLLFQELLDKISKPYNELINSQSSSLGEGSQSQLSGRQNSASKDHTQYSLNNSRCSNPTKINNFIFQQSQPKYQIITAAQEALGSILGGVSKKYERAEKVQGLWERNSHHNQKSKRACGSFVYQSISDKKICNQIMQICSDCIQDKIISGLPQYPPFQNNSDMLDFDAIESSVIKKLGQKDSLISLILKTQLFAVFAEEKYE